nr:cephalosporin hydroxylase family protein [uncultured Undibacterium sp.]
MHFDDESKERINAISKNTLLKDCAHSFLKESLIPKYSYNFSWLGRPIIQYPQDIIAMQELIWEVKPDLIIETGIAHGGSLIFYASMLELCALSGGPQDAQIIGIDIDIRAHNRQAIVDHPMNRRITMFEGSSIAPEMVAKVVELASQKKNIMLVLDSNHTHDHVLAELNAYASLTSLNSYCVVFDTVIEDMPDGMFNDRPWGVGNNPKTAVHAYLQSHPEFVIDKNMDHKLQISVAPDGFLKRIS